MKKIFLALILTLLPKTVLNCGNFVSSFTDVAVSTFVETLSNIDDALVDNLVFGLKNLKEKYPKTFKQLKEDLEEDDMDNLSHNVILVLEEFGIKCRDYHLCIAVEQLKYTSSCPENIEEQ